MLTNRCLGMLSGLCLVFQVYAADLEIHNPWIREAPPVAKNHAAYLQIKNNSDRDRELIEINADDYAATMLHQTLQEKDMMSMIHLPVLKIPARSTVSLEPGGIHVMLMQPKRPLQSGDVVKLVLHFDNNTDLSINVPVKNKP